MMRENQRLLNQLHVFTDGLAVFLAMLVSYWLRFSLFRGVRGMPLNYYIWLGVVAAALTLAVFAVAGLYESFRTVRFHVEASRVAALELLVSLIVMAAIYVLRLGETSRWTVVFFYAVSTLLLTGKRAAMRLLLRRCRAMGYNQKRVLLVGHGEGAEAYLTRVAMDKNLGFRVIGYVAERGCWDALPYCGSYEELDAIFASEKPDEVVVALPTEEGRWMGRIINACEKDGTKLSVVPSYVRYMPANPQFDSVNGLPLINLRRIPLDNLGNAFLKRAADIICSLVLIILTSPLMLIAAIGVKLSSPGPIIFRQERVGYHGETFTLYKFRSMCPNAESKLNDLLQDNEMDGPVFKMKDDPRITRVGHFIRKTSIDELPQLVNILMGDMSIVGPRPALPREVAQYTPYEWQRLYVTPGLSCYWQIAPHRNQLSFEEWMALDVKYVKERSFLVDWKIIFATFRAVLFGHGE